MKKVVLFISQFIIACAVLSWEHTFSLPILFFALSILFFEWQPAYYRQLLLVLLSIAVASLYQLPFTLSLILMLVTLGGYTLLGQVLHQQVLKLGIWAVIMSLILGTLTDFHWSSGSGVTFLVSLVLLIVISRFMQWEAPSEYSQPITNWDDQND